MPATAEDTTVETLNPGASLTVTVPTRYRTTATLFVDDGAGGDPTVYDLEWEVYAESLGTWLSFASAAGSTARLHAEDAVPEQMRATLTNAAANTDPASNYRVRLVTHG